MSEHARDNRAAALLSIASNAGLTLVKLVLGLVSGSVAVLSDAANSAGDLVASGVAFVAVRASARPPDHNHPYGHEKAENLAAAVEGTLVLAAAGAVSFEAIRRLATGAPAVDHLPVAIAVMVASAAVNLVVSARLHAVARRTGSPAIEGDATHLASDVWTSGGTALGLTLVAVTGWRPLDAIVALVVAAYVMWVGVRLLLRAGRVLLDEGLSDEEIAAVNGVLDGFASDGVSFHAVRGRRAGNKRLIDFHMVVPPETTVREGHALSGRVKGAVCGELPNSEVLIHLEDH